MKTLAKMESNKKRVRKLIGCVLVMLPAIFAHAQTNTKNLGNEDITIVKEYQPVLNDAFKISLSPQGDTSTSIPTVLNYTVEPQQMNTNFNITPIKPVKIKDEVIKKLYRGFVKGGYGNYNTPLAEVYYNSLRSKSFDAGVHFKHISSTGKIKDYGYPGFSNSQIGVSGTKFFDKNMLQADIDYHRDVYHFYGYKSPPELFTKNETKHLFSDVHAAFTFSNNNTDKDAIKYSAGFAVYSFVDNFNSDESGETITGMFGKNIGKSLIKVNLSAALTQFKQSQQNLNRNMFTIQPRYEFNKGLINLSAGTNIDIESSDDLSRYHMYPHVQAKYKIVDEALSVVAQVSGGLKQNTLRKISKENPFLDDFTSLKNTNDKLNLSLGVFAKLSHDVDANATVRYSRLTNQLFFVNKNELPVKYATIYDDANLIALHVQLDYNQAEKMVIGLNIDFDSYDTDELGKPLFKPLYRIGLNGKHIVADKIEIKPEIYFNGNSYAFDYNTTNPTFKTIKGYVDLNLGVDYLYTKNLTLFAQINNIAMSRYSYWSTYPNYRLNALAGLKYSF